VTAAAVGTRSDSTVYSIRKVLRTWATIRSTGGIFFVWFFNLDAWGRRPLGGIEGMGGWPVLGRAETSETWRLAFRLGPGWGWFGVVRLVGE
jgi:hypothetical protein